MSSLSSLSRAVSAMMSNQSALNTSAHNLTNINTPGYVRQQVVMAESGYSKVGMNETTDFQVGLGVDVQAIRQVRDQFLDTSYRQERGRYGFYDAQNTGIEEIEIILGEIEGESFSTVLNDLWVSLNELAKHPDGLETRGTFIQNASLFVNRTDLISKQLNDYQLNMNEDVKSMVSRINEIGDEIYQLNEVIVSYEIGDGNANDYRDQRNILVDELSKLIDVSAKEDSAGNVKVRIENTEFITTAGVNHMGLEASEPYSNLVSPVWPHVANYPVFNFDVAITPESNNDKGALKGLLITRGIRQGSYTDMIDQATYEADIKPSIIMNAQAQFDQLVHGIATTINDILSPNTVGPPPMLDTANAPYGLDGTQGFEVFKRTYVDRYNGLNEYNVEDPLDPYTLYSSGNLEINQELLTDYDKLPLQKLLNEPGDSTIINDMLNAWDQPFSSLEPGLTAKLNFNDYYKAYVGDVGNNGYAVGNIVDNQQMMIQQIDNQRSSLQGVSSDEELGNVIKYQHAYNAAAKVVSTVDQMIETLVTSTGLVGR
ncbi:MAG: flagellar hook-associated protein FlgK [Vallitaleaceae bacterium]|jgi:flagellar hook-associated protein 1 FlgK|nr:flagellar hook-associated protein FlgK [Vallitaleaceae bacterium]